MTLRGRHGRDGCGMAVQMLGAIARSLLLSERSSATPVVLRCASDNHRSAQVRAVTGNLRQEPWQRGDKTGLARFAAISEGKERTQRMCESVAKLARSGADTSIAERVMATSGLRRSTIFPGRVKLLSLMIRSHSPFRERCLSEGCHWLSVTAGFLHRL
jgi:hypothetical protein